MRHADHKLVITGTWEGDLLYDLHCLHLPEDWHTDDQGVIHETCLVQDWWDNDRRDVLGHSTTLTPQGHILFWTTWNWDSEPTLVGREQYREWKDSQDD